MRSGSTRWRAPWSLRHALDDDPRGAGAGDLRAHLVEAVGDVADLGLARGVLDHGGAVGERRPPSARCGCRRPSPWETRSRRPSGRSWRGRSRSRASISISAPSRSSAMISRSTGRVPMAQPPGSDTLRLAHAREQRRDHPEARPHLARPARRARWCRRCWRPRCAASGRRTAVSPGRLPPTITSTP